MSKPNMESKMSTVSFFVKKVFNFPYRQRTHSETIKSLFQTQPLFFGEQPILVELGAGLTTLTLAEIAAEKNAIFYSCDNNEKKIEDLKNKNKPKLDNVIFMPGDSLESLRLISSRHPKIHFILFDSAPSAMHTFKEFMIIEKCMAAGTFILIDNAALPDEKQALLSPCRKGKILVPYLLASSSWEVSGHPHAGDSMVSAVYCDDSDHADPGYERSEGFRDWRYGE
jgi:predicted O-methyltransferase YrrM